MPTVFRQDGFRFFFYSNEGDPREPVHIHARDAEGEAKLWVQPEVAVAHSVGLNARALRQLVEIVTGRRAEIEEAWHDHFD